MHKQNSRMLWGCIACCQRCKQKYSDPYSYVMIHIYVYTTMRGQIKGTTGCTKPSGSHPLELITLKLWLHATDREPIYRHREDNWLASLLLAPLICPHTMTYINHGNTLYNKNMQISISVMGSLWYRLWCIYIANWHCYMVMDKWNICACWHRQRKKASQTFIWSIEPGSNDWKSS